MSQVHVERLIGILATDEALRRRFSSDPRSFIAEMIAKGVELNDCERWALACLAPGDLERFAQAIGPRLQKSDLKGCEP